MYNAKGAKTLSKVMVTFLIIALLLPVNFVKAVEISEINPATVFDFVLVMEGQTASVSSTQITPFDFQTIGIASIGNITLTASLNMSGLTPADPKPFGYWWVSIMDIGGRIWFDLVFGAPNVAGPGAKIDVYGGLGFAFVTGGTSLTSPVSAENPAKYTITVTGGKE
jgi:hypothetical protein